MQGTTLTKCTIFESESPLLGSGKFPWPSQGQRIKIIHLGKTVFWVKSVHD